MAKRPAKTTALGIVKTASGLSYPAFAKLLGMSSRRVQSYVLGTRKLPPASEISNLETLLGIDLESLKTPRPRMISGRAVSPELVKGWRKHGGIDPEAASLAVDQLAPMLNATISVLSKQDQQRAHLLLARIQSLLEEELTRGIIAEEVASIIDSTVLVRISERYRSPKEMIEEAKDLPVGHPRWKATIQKMNQNLPVTVDRVTRPTWGLPIDKAKVDHKGKKSTGFRSSRKIKNEIVISQSGAKPHRFGVEKMTSKISGIAE
jgi:hypothetical protein